MKPNLGTPYDTKWEGVPPAMPAQDYALWRRYRSVLIGEYDRVYFNVRVGEPIPVAEDLPPEIKIFSEAVSRRRVDVVAEKAAGWLLVELKYNAGAEGLGQILLYQSLWKSDPPDDRPVVPLIVSNFANKDLVLGCKFYGVELLVV